MCAFPCAGDFPDGIYGVNLPDDWTYARGAEVDGLMTMTFTSQAASEVLAGGQTNYLVLFNVDRGTILKQVPSPRVLFTVATIDQLVYQDASWEGDLRR
jgi:hypothetical protein